MKKLLLVLVALLMGVSSVWAQCYDFSAVNADRKTIYYDIIGPYEVGVTSSPRDNTYSGEINIPASVRYCGDTYLVTLIADGAFGSCNGLTSVTIPNSVTTIGKSAFYGCSGLTSVTIGNSVTTIDESAFYNCSGLTSVTIGNSVTTIGSDAFVYCSGLTSVAIPTSVTTIGGSAFKCCSSLTSVTIPNSVTTIGHGAFIGCSSLTSVTIPNSVTTIEDRTFTNCSRLTSVTIPNSVTTIGELAFYGCSGLTSVTIPNSVTTIGGSAFNGCSSLTSVTIPDSVTTIGSSVFKNCSGLTSVMIPNSVTTIGYGAFSGCSDLTSITIPNSVTTIGIRAFDGCNGLTSITIPNSVKTLGKEAFRNCSGLTSVILPNKLDTIHEGSFFGCSGLTSIVIPSSVKVIEDVSDHNSWHKGVFEACTSLSSITIGDSVTTIGNYAFYNCSMLDSVNIGIGIYRIGNWTFADCYNIEYLKIDAVRPPSVMDHTFHNVNSQASVFVPCVSISRYENNYGAYFANIQSGNSPLVEVLSNNDEWGFVTGGDNYLCMSNVTINAIANYGYHFVQWNDGYTENPRVIRLSQDTCITARFAKNIYSISVESSNINLGNVMGSGNFGYLTNVMISASPNYGYHFTQWRDGNTENPRIISLVQDTNMTAEFAINSYNVTLQSDNSVMGSVTGGGSFDYLSNVMVNAIANYGYHFTQWSDGNRENPRMVRLMKDTSMTAQFAKNRYTITIESSDGSIGNVMGSGDFDYLTDATINATPQYGYHFTQWSDGNTENPRIIKVTQDSNIVARFVANSYRLTGKSADSTKGTVVGSGSYDYLADVTLNAIANYGYHFVQWSDGNRENPRIINLTQDTSITAHFTINNYAISIMSSNEEMGNAIGSGNYNYFSDATISATANYGYHFVQWSDGNTENPRTLKVVQDSNIVAQFTANTYNISVGSDDMGNGSVVGGGNYDYLTNVTLNAIANYGYHFTQWNDGNMENPRTVIITQDTNLTAQFAINRYVVSVESMNEEMGSVVGGGNYNHFSECTISAIANSGYHFSQWSDGNTENPRVIHVIQDSNIIAQFAIDTYIVLVESAAINMGSVNGSGEYDYLSEVTISATANYGYHFVQWSDGNTENPRVINLVRDTNMIAQFGLNSYSVVVESGDSVMGSVNGSGSYDYLSEVTIGATANYGYHFTQWSDGNTENPRVINLVRDTNMVAQFGLNSYSVVVESGDSVMGNVTGSGDYEYLTDVTLNATANYGYHFIQWNDGNTENPRVINLVQDTNMIAQFGLNSYSVVVESGDSVMGSVTGGGSYDYLSDVSIEAISNYGYHFIQWSDGNVENPRVVHLTQDTSMTAQFAKNTYTISVESSNVSLGSVTGSGSFDYLTNIMISAMANYGYHFTQWSDGNTENPRVVSVQRDSTIIAEFAKNNYVVKVESCDTVKGSVTGGGTYEYLSEALISARANYGYEFKQWSDGNTEQMRTITVMEDVTYTAIFKTTVAQYTINVMSSNESYGTVAGGGEYNEGTSIVITATPNEGYRFVSWNDGSTENPRTITVADNATYIATFAEGEPEGIEDVDGLHNVSVYPNPTSGMITISAEGVEKVEVMNMVGNKVAEFKGESMIDLSELSSGVYMLRIMTDEGMALRRVIKK